MGLRGRVLRQLDILTLRISKNSQWIPLRDGREGTGLTPVGVLAKEPLYFTDVEALRRFFHILIDKGVNVQVSLGEDSTYSKRLDDIDEMVHWVSRTPHVMRSKMVVRIDHDSGLTPFAEATFIAAPRNMRITEIYPSAFREEVDIIAHACDATAETLPKFSSSTVVVEPVGVEQDSQRRIEWSNIKKNISISAVVGFVSSVFVNLFFLFVK